MRLPFTTLQLEFERILLSLNFTPEKATACAHIFASNSLDGIYTHGLNRFPSFVEYIKMGLVDIHAEPVAELQQGMMERWDGRLGPGVLNAGFCMDRAIKLAKEHGISCISLRNTNHWMRGGTYGWQAAEAGMIGICFTNTIANMPPWGGTESRLGNNPMVIAVPRKEGHVVLDMAISQFSFGKMGIYRAKGEQLPFDGGYDAEGKLTKDPTSILRSLRALPIGYWKGSALSMMIDILVTVLSNGNSTEKITASGNESGSSNVFICIRPENNEHLLNEILEFTRSSEPLDAANPVRYPGESTLRTRIENTENGIPVDEHIWQKVLAL